jgi:5-(carboxyamino)imidazole ribonucleotide synthase
MKVVQDKFLQKEALSSGGLPVPKFRAVGSIAEIRIAGNEFGWPVVLKKRCNGYDGKGNFTIRSASDISEGWRVLEGGKHPLMVEEFYPFTQELAVMITRGRDGSVVSYPVVQTVQEDHVCRTVSAPATVSESIAVQAREIGIKAVEQVGMVGTMGVEMFLTAAGDLCINELAPRVHNSGHYTIEACDCSQFENHIRAVLGWPLGSTAMVAPCAVMVNLLATGPGSGVPQGMETVLGMPGVHLHLYGKSKAGKGRKMGHITVIGNQSDELMARAEKAASSLSFV